MNKTVAEALALVGDLKRNWPISGGGHRRLPALQGAGIGVKAGLDSNLRLGAQNMSQQISERSPARFARGC